ncbi:caspase family protein [Labrys neptuniae]
MFRPNVIAAALAAALVLSAPALAQGTASFASSQSTASQFSAQQIADLQDDLAWAGIFSDVGTLPSQGLFDETTFEAIRRYERQNGKPDTGQITPALIEELHARFDSIRQGSKFKALGDGTISVSYPSGILTSSKKGKNGPEYSSAKRDVIVQFVSIVGSRDALDQLFANMKKTAGKAMKYAVMLDGDGNARPARFILASGSAKESLYVSFMQKGNAIVGFIASWNPKQRPAFIDTAVAMAISLRPQAGDTASTVVAGGSGPAGTTPSTSELNRQLDICATAKDAAEIVNACTAALSTPTLLASNRPTVLFNRSIGYNRQKKADLALADLDQAIALAPNQANYYTQRGHVRYAQAKYDAAVADYSQALTKKTATAEDYNNRGNSYFGAEDYQSAIADYDASLRLDANDSDVHAFRGAALLRLSRPSEAMADLTFAIERGGDKISPGDYKNRGEALVELGRPEEAQPDFAKAEALASAKIPTDSYNLIYRAFARAFSGNAEGAIADANQYLAGDPKASEAFHARALGFAAKHDFTSAIADFSQAISLGRKRMFIQRQRGDAFLAAGQPDQAVADYQAQLKLTPGNALALVGLEKAKQALDAKQIALGGAPQGGNVPAPATALAALPPQAKVALGRRVALVIGNSNYANVAALPNPKNDAAKVAETLRKIGFAEVTLVEDTDFRGLNRALQDFAGKADGADWAVIYYAGHGIEIANTNYLVPVDAKLASDRDVSFEAVPLDRVMAASEGAKGMRLVILDACRNNPFLANMTRKTATRAVTRGLSRVEPDGGTLVVYAAKAGEVALDGNGGNSPFVTALTNNLQKPGVEIGKLFRLVRDDVMKATDRKQEPFTYGSLPGEDFIFNPG